MGEERRGERRGRWRETNGPRDGQRGTVRQTPPRLVKPIRVMAIEGVPMGARSLFIPLFQVWGDRSSGAGSVRRHRPTVVPSTASPPRAAEGRRPGRWRGMGEERVSTGPRPVPRDSETARNALVGGKVAVGLMLSSQSSTTGRQGGPARQKGRNRLPERQRPLRADAQSLLSLLSCHEWREPRSRLRERAASSVAGRVSRSSAAPSPRAWPSSSPPYGVWALAPCCGPPMWAFLLC